MTLFVFILLALKYAEVTWRYPEGGGVVNISSQALHPFAGLLGGLFILVDYYLTAASARCPASRYLAVVVPVAALGNAVPGTLVALVGARGPEHLSASRRAPTVELRRRRRWRPPGSSLVVVVVGGPPRAGGDPAQLQRLSAQGRRR